MKRTAQLSPCGTYRFRLGRRWDDRPVLLACMFNPSWANGQQDDQTCTLLCHIASHSGFGGLTTDGRTSGRCSSTGCVTWRDL